MRLASVSLWILGQSEFFAPVIEHAPVLETAPIGFILWEIWLIVVGVFLLRKNGGRRIVA
ncbi:hypothetical protein NIES4071_43970 [Calothrix sp. NIES-4071]|nr:hypothetical protein NIES4071_43970 [Calothrix sp. NIES-4071]BAZ58711.1 hypothetical protein NIES4105_43900 [Calothrix sp. NIES-4105]